MIYMGSKSRIAKDIVPIIQHYIDINSTDEYYEPFVGGANVIDKIHSSHKHGSDLNQYLIALLKHVSKGGELLPEVPKDVYDLARSAWRNGDTSEFEEWQIGNIGFLASYNGRWFDGGYAKPGYVKTNNSLKYRDYYKESCENLMRQAPNLQGIIFESCDYRDIKPDNAVVYCDPPYNGVKQYANARAFNYTEFWDQMKKWSDNNIVIVSERTAPDDWNIIWEGGVLRTIKSTEISHDVERLFIHSKNSLK